MQTSLARSVADVHARLAGARSRLLARDGEIARSQVELSQIPAPTGSEERRAATVADGLRAAGLRDVHIDPMGNVIGRRPGSDPGAAPIVVCAHLDTVFPAGTPLTVRREGPLLVGPGIGDNGRGLAVMLALAGEMDGVRLRTRRPVIFAATVGEEGSGDLRGARALFAGPGSGAAGAIALDGAGDERVVHDALGSRRYRIVFSGSGGHSWAAYGIANPVHAAAATAAMIARITPPSSPRTTLSVTRIGGGTSVNTIAEEAWLEVDLRSTSASLLDRYSAAVTAAATAAVNGEDARRLPGSPPLRMEVQAVGDRPCGEVPADAPLVLTAFQATRLVGRNPAAATASTDANVPISLGIPAVAIGAGGRGGGAHTLSEWYDNTDGAVGVARALTIVAAAAELDPGGGGG